MEIEKCLHSEDNNCLAEVSYASILSLLAQKLQGEAKVIVWLNHCVQSGYFSEGKIRWSEGVSDFNARQFLELRAFNPSEEVYIVGNKWRYINDTTGAEIEYVDSASRLWGEKVKAADGFVTLCDAQRQMQLVVPADECTKYLELQLRSYIGYNKETGQAGYSTYRYVDIRERGK